MVDQLIYFGGEEKVLPLRRFIVIVGLQVRGIDLDGGDIS